MALLFSWAQHPRKREIYRKITNKDYQYKFSWSNLYLSFQTILFPTTNDRQLGAAAIQWVKVSFSVMSGSLQPHRLYSPWNSPGQNTGVGSLSLLQGIIPTQGSNPGLLHCRWILYQLSHKGSPRILEWVAYPFSSRSSWPRNRTGVFCTAGGFFTNWAVREAWIVFMCFLILSESFLPFLFWHFLL